MSGGWEAGRLGSGGSRAGGLPARALGRTFHFRLLASRAVRGSPSSAQPPGLLGTGWAAPDASAAAHGGGREDGPRRCWGPGLAPGRGLAGSRPSGVLLAVSTVTALETRGGHPWAGPPGLKGLPCPSEEDPDAREAGAKGGARGWRGLLRVCRTCTCRSGAVGGGGSSPAGGPWPRACSPRTLRRQDVL